MSNTDELIKRLDAYIRTTLLPRLGCSKRDSLLEPAHAGMHSQVFFLTVEDERPLVLKVIPKRRRFRALVECSQHLRHNGMPVPEIIKADEDNRLFNRRGMHVLCEERICGQTLQHAQRSPELIAQAACLFSRMHRCARDRWGHIP